MEEKTSFYMKKNFKLMKNNTFNNVFCNGIFLYCRFLLIFKKNIEFS